MLTTALLTAAHSGPSSLTPDASALPGTNIVQRLANGVAYWALIASMVGIVVGAVLWAFGHYSQNYQQAYNGRKGVMVSGLAALLMGAAPTLVNLFVAQGGNVK